MTTEDLPFRIEAANGNHYVVEDNGDRSKRLTECPNRMASAVELQLWTALEKAIEAPAAEPEPEPEPVEEQKAPRKSRSK